MKIALDESRPRGSGTVPQTKEEMDAALARLGPLPMESLRAVVCAIKGHSNIVNVSFGQITCARCGALLGDMLMGTSSLDGCVVLGVPETNVNRQLLKWDDCYMVEEKTGGTDPAGPPPAWYRCRFLVPEVFDYRPVTWPPPGPYWLDSEVGRGCVVVAYVKRMEQLGEFWPDAIQVTSEPEAEIVFTHKFSCPKWWDEAKMQAKLQNDGS